MRYTKKTEYGLICMVYLAKCEDASRTTIKEIAQKEKDYSTHTFLDWFVNEQVEEEKKFETILQKFELIGRDKLAINEIDKILGSLATK